MDRRKFIISGIAGIATSSILKNTSIELNAQTRRTRKGNFDIVAVRGGEPVAMYNRAMTAMGGMGKYVKRGQTVVVKPNIAWDTSPERAANTNPELVGSIVKSCLDAGAKEVIVFDNTCDNWRRAYENSGIEKAASDAGAKVMSANSENYYKEVNLPKGKSLKTTKVHEAIIDCDVFINVPVLKSHGSATVTIAMKNLMGIVWDRRWWHRNNLHQCIADSCTYRLPDLNIVDAYRVMVRNGPKGVSEEDVVMMKNLIISEDIVAADAASTLVFGSKPEDIAHIKIADEMNIGTMNLDSLKIERIRM